jgi:fructose-bisphosphate aldolase class I
VERLEDIAARMVTAGKGILAADESSGTITRRFDALGIASTGDNRRDYREMLFRTDEGMRNHVSGVILYDETLRQKAKDGTPLVQIIQDSGAVPGIKVDMGTKPLALAPGEVITEGLDGLRDRLEEYYKLGARFAKWRAVINIGAGLPTDNAIHANAHALARYAALCQEAGIVPIVEPEVLMDGSPATHDIDTSYAATERTLKVVFEQLALTNVNLKGIVLKPSMVIPGKNAPKQASAQEVAERTVAVLKATVPADVPGIAFLSGGQSDTQATEHLSLMNQIDGKPWALTFSYGRALQAAALKAFLHRVRMNGLAALGKWTSEAETNG